MSELPPITSDLDEDWSRLVRLFATWKFFLPHWRDLIIGVLRFGSNFATGTLKLTYWRRGWAMMAERPIAIIQRLKARSELNLRQVESFFRFIFVTFLSIPITTSLVIGQLFPDIWGHVIANQWSWFSVLGIWAAIVILFWAGAWKARELDAFLTLLLNERGIPTAQAEELGITFEPEG